MESIPYDDNLDRLAHHMSFPNVHYTAISNLTLDQADAFVSYITHSPHLRLNDVEIRAEYAIRRNDGRFVVAFLHRRNTNIGDIITLVYSRNKLSFYDGFGNHAKISFKPVSIQELKKTLKIYSKLMEGDPNFPTALNLVSSASRPSSTLQARALNKLLEREASIGLIRRRRRLPRAKK
jgi:hypothetical protein